MIIVFLALDAKSAFQFVFPKIKDKASQDTLRSLASSIKAGRAANFRLSGRLVNMPMHADQGL